MTQDMRFFLSLHPAKCDTEPPLDATGGGKQEYKVRTPSISAHRTWNEFNIPQALITPVTFSVMFLERSGPLDNRQRFDTGSYSQTDLSEPWRPSDALGAHVKGLGPLLTWTLMPFSMSPHAE